MRVFDGYCAEGGAGTGYERAGHDVIGMDIKPFKRNPHPMIVGSVLDQPVSFLKTFDLLHGSPPCQFGTALRHAPGNRASEHLNLIPTTRALYEASGRPYVIENVANSYVAQFMPGAVTLCGCMFGLGAQGCRLERKRLFQANWPIRQPACVCKDDPRPVIGIYGGHARRRSAAAGGRGTKDIWEGGHVAAASEALGIQWMTMEGLSQAIPPAYTSYVADEFVFHFGMRNWGRMVA